MEAMEQNGSSTLATVIMLLVIDVVVLGGLWWLGADKGSLGFAGLVLLMINVLGPLYSNTTGNQD